MIANQKHGEGKGAKKLERRWGLQENYIKLKRELVLTVLHIFCDGKTGPNGGWDYSLRYYVTSWKVSVVERGNFNSEEIHGDLIFHTLCCTNVFWSKRKLKLINSNKKGT